MYRKEKPLALKSSASLISNNLTVLNNAEKGSINYAVIHKYLINMVCQSTDGSQVIHKQVMFKEPSAATQGTAMIMQTKWVTLRNGRSLLVLTSLKGIQIFEYDGSAMVYWHALGDSSSEAAGESTNFGRGIATVGDNLLCVGTQQGHILVFDIPVKGNSVSLANTVGGHSVAVCDLAGQDDTLVSGDENGTILLWRVQGTSLSNTSKISMNGESCCSLSIWKGILVAAFSNGQIGVYNLSTGKIGALVNAHARWINAIDVAKETGLMVSASEDSFVRVWQLIPGNQPSIEFKFGDTVFMPVFRIEFKFGDTFYLPVFQI
ncbi:WD repeat-containing protein 54-like isoform X2 [Dreissena polymorpha]|uniref:WD repeat-containing protein 54-like isoform X2 n=1 Tax=Dreissena polymorpha TaxID=45954 RepID=UPI002264853B|nr:WD repeat-containing protein 54-like isoform X2 [Dreissena polymorpha]